MYGTHTCVLVHKGLCEEKQVSLKSRDFKWKILESPLRLATPLSMTLYVKLCVCGMIVFLEGAQCSVHQNLIGVLENVSL